MIFRSVDVGLQKPFEEDDEQLIPLLCVTS